MENAPVIELRGVTATRSGYEILKDISFSLADGETSVFMGGAGSGKSSLLKTAAGVTIPDGGKVLFRGRDLAAMSRAEELEFHRLSGFVFQDAALWANQSLFDNLALPCRFHDPRLSKAEVERAVRRAAEIVGYRDELSSRPAELSSGERRLIGLARALVLDPELLFMDEPASYLDEESADRVYDIIAQLRARRRTIAVVSGSSDIAYRFADALGVLKEGRLLAFGPYAEAVAWSDPSLRSATGRLRARKKAAEGDAALIEAWAEALASAPDPEPRGSPPGPEPGGGAAGRAGDGSPGGGAGGRDGEAKDEEDA